MKLWSRAIRVVLALAIAAQSTALLPAMAAASQGSKPLAVKAIGEAELKSEFGAGGGGGGGTPTTPSPPSCSAPSDPPPSDPVDPDPWMYVPPPPTYGWEGATLRLQSLPSCPTSVGHRFQIDWTMNSRTVSEVGSPDTRYNTNSTPLIIDYSYEVEGHYTITGSVSSEIAAGLNLKLGKKIGTLSVGGSAQTALEYSEGSVSRLRVATKYTIDPKRAVTFRRNSIYEVWLGTITKWWIMSDNSSNKDTTFSTQYATKHLYGTSLSTYSCDLNGANCR
jgi:hypothetical protein